MAQVDMMNKYLNIILIFVLLAGGLFVIPLKQANADDLTYNHIIPFTITDTSGVARANVPVIITYDVTGKLTDYGLITATATDTRVDSSGSGSNSPVGTGTELNYTMSTANFTAVIPSLPAYGSVTINLYTGYDPVRTSFPIVLGNGGYFTNADNITELSDNFSISTSGYYDLSSENIVYDKPEAIRLQTYNGTSIIGGIYQANGLADGYSDPDSGWASEANASDNDTGTTSTSNNTAQNDWTSYLYLTYSYNPFAVGFKYYYNTNYWLNVDIDAYYDGVWNDVVETAVVKAAWASYNMTSPHIITQARIRFQRDAGAGDPVPISLGEFQFYGYSPYVSETGLSSGEKNVVISANGTNLSLDIDSVNVDLIALSGNNTVDNSNDWKFMSLATPYLSSVNITQGGILRAQYLLSSIVSGTTLPDASGNGAAGVIVWGTNSDMTITGGDIMDSISATSVATTSAMMQGNLFYIGTYSSVYLSFEYGLDTNYGYFTSESSATVEQTFSVTLTGLTPNTTYHYRAVARNGIVYSYGEDMEFTTGYSTSSMGSTTPIIIGVGVFSGYIGDGDLIFCVEVICTYPPYYPTGIPSEYFQVQLLDTDGTTLLAASPIVQWGDRPESIYLNATVAATLTDQAAYTIRVANISSENITVNTSYTLTASDWKGDDLERLDDWCIGAAANMQITDGVGTDNPYLTTITDYGVVITDAAGGYFTLGIPNIAQVRPNLFTTAEHKMTMATLSGDVNYNAGVTTSTRLGTHVTDDAQTVADVFGITGDNLLLYLILAVVLFCIAYTVNSTQGFGALGALCLAVPIIGASAYFAVLNVVIPVMIAVIMTFLFVRQFIWKTL